MFIYCILVRYLDIGCIWIHPWSQIVYFSWNCCYSILQYVWGIVVIGYCYLFIFPALKLLCMLKLSIFLGQNVGIDSIEDCDFGSALKTIKPVHSTKCWKLIVISEHSQLHPLFTFILLIGVEFLIYILPFCIFFYFFTIKRVLWQLRLPLV